MCKLRRRNIGLPSKQSFIFMAMSILAFLSKLALAGLFVKMELFLLSIVHWPFSFLKQHRVPEDGRGSVIEARCVRSKFQLERTEKTFEQFENASRLRSAWMNKIASLILNSNQMCQFSAPSEAFAIHSCKYSHWRSF